MDGEFVKYINNDGTIGIPRPWEKVVYEKAEALTHFSYQESDEKLLLVDLQGSGYVLYDPEIATSDELENKDPEKYFCGGNLNEAAFEKFFSVYKFNIYCKMLSLTGVEITAETESDSS